MKLAVTGASGTLGRLVADQLLADSHGHEVTLFSRDPAPLSGLGAETRRVDFNDPSTFAGAFAGVERLLLISADLIGQRVPQQQAAIDGAVAAGVRHIAYTSIGDPSDSNPSLVAQDHRRTEEHLRASGAAWTFLRNAIYTEMLLGPARGALATGRYVVNEGQGRIGHVARADCAAAAVAVLVGDGHEGRAYDVTGPEALDATQRAALLAELGGAPVEVVDVDDAAYAAGLVEHAGLPKQIAAGVASLGAATRRGYADSVSEVIEQLTGRAPRTVREVLTEAFAS